MLQRFKIWLLSKLHKRIYKTYESIDFLPIWNYKEIEKGIIEKGVGDLRYLVKGLDYEHLPNIYLNLVSIWERIFNSFIINANPEKLHEISQEFKMENYQYGIYNRLVLAYNTLKFYELCPEKNRMYFINDIRSLGYKFNDSTEDNYCNSVLDLKRQITGLKRNIDFSQGQKLEEIKKLPPQPDIEYILTLFTDVFPGTIFNSKTLTCKQYLNYLKRYNKVVTQSKQPQNNGH